MLKNRSLLLSAAVAFAVSAGCEVHEHDSAPASVGVQADVSVGEPQGAVIEGPGVVAIDVEPDPVQRVYVYDEGYPPGTYIYDNYYYYGGYRYPRDVFVNRYVQENIRSRRFINVEQNRTQGKVIEQRHRTEFAQTHGVRTKAAGRSTAQPNQQFVPGRQPATPDRQPQTPDRRPETPIRQPETPARQPETPRVNPERPDNRTPAVKEEDRVKVQQPEKKTPAEEEKNNAKPAEEQRKADKEDPKRDEPKGQ